MYLKGRKELNDAITKLINEHDLSIEEVVRLLSEEIREFSIMLLKDGDK